MGAMNSRRRQAKVPNPQGSTPMNNVSPYPNARPGTPVNNLSAGYSPLSRRQQQKLDEAYRTIQTLQNQIRNSGMNYPNTGFYDGSPIINRPPSPILSQFSNRASPYIGSSPASTTAYRDTDYNAVANIAGLNPADVALLHREFLNLTRGGINKMDRVVFRQLLRESLIEANNENIDRAIENIFVSIDRNRDGFIDFPEFIGAFRDILRGQGNDPQSYLGQQALSDIVNEQNRVLTNNQQLQIFSQPTQSQAPIVYNSPNPLVISLDSNAASPLFNTFGQSFLAPSTQLQCMPLPTI